MQRSSFRILTTHAGSLPRPAALKAMQAERQPGDDETYNAAVRAAVSEAVRSQEDVGISVLNDGEVSKVGGFSGYVRTRLNGFEGGDVEERPMPGSARQFPDWNTFAKWPRMIGHDPVSWKNFSAVETDIANLKQALATSSATQAFLPASSPGTILNHNSNTHYASRTDYLEALANLMKREYDAIVAAGLLLQIDCPDLAAAHDNFYPDLSVKEFRTIMAENIEAMNYATRDIAPENMRIHTCWGGGAGPHTGDVAMKDIVDVLLTARPAGLSFVAANGRHAHEWRVWEDTPLPDGKVLIPGVIDSTTSIVEHPEAVAERINRFVKLVGRENVIAGTDCGFGYALPASIVWAKLKALSDGAELASHKR